MFSNHTDETINFLPKYGTVNYYGKPLTRTKADHYLEKLLTTIEWKNDDLRKAWEIGIAAEPTF